jgi:hypothetical protein
MILIANDLKQFCSYSHERSSPINVRALIGRGNGLLGEPVQTI